MLDKETVKEMIQEFEGLSILVLKHDEVGEDYIYVCNDRAINERVRVKKDVNRDTYITVSQIKYYEKYMILYFVKTVVHDGERESIKSNKFSIPYSNIAYVRSLMK